MFWEIAGYVVIGTAVGGTIAWNYALWCVDESVKIINNSIRDKKLDYSEEEIQVLQNFLEESLNKLK